jgi:predicted GNAT superfamily acetyltransferase
MGKFRIERVTTLEGMEEVSVFFREVWKGGPDVVPFDLGIAMLHVGAYCSAAFEGEEIVGASFGLEGRMNGSSILHSHVTGSFRPGAGYELKLDQFVWAKENNIEAITWSFDPLVRRNCVFNFDKLGATAIEYLPNFYGTMTDEINAGDDSDRLFAWWPTTRNNSPEQPTTELSCAVFNDNGHPVVSDCDPAHPFTVYLPENIEAMRQTDLSLACQWRIAVREALEPAFSQGATISHTLNREALIVIPQPK